MKYTNFEVRAFDGETSYSLEQIDSGQVKYKRMDWSIYATNDFNLLMWLADCGDRQIAEYLVNKLNNGR